MITDLQLGIQNFQKPIKVLNDWREPSDDSINYLGCFIGRNIVMQADKLRQNPIQDANH